MFKPDNSFLGDEKIIIRGKKLLSRPQKLIIRREQDLY